MGYEESRRFDTYGTRDRMTITLSARFSSFRFCCELIERGTAFPEYDHFH